MRNRTYKMARMSLGIAVVGVGLIMTPISSPVMAESAATLANPHHAGIPGPKTFHTNHLPIPTHAQSVPRGPLPPSVTVSAGKARSVAIKYIEWHRPTKQIVPPTISQVTLVTSSAAEQQAGSQPGLPPYLWKVNFCHAKFDMFGIWPRGALYINTETGAVAMGHGAPHSQRDQRT
ncbi:hypothetical protein [Sulfobacillus thermosulfidooxidans]|uniref:hypothetical protein n=1 Tax=Sulfobacillus thermosulfidooxidans TaxID=28034 RepID=UPI0002E00DE1|nr:hypothetical protein [Sulfobacillus thermosulfidooxidans]